MAAACFALLSASVSAQIYNIPPDIAPDSVGTGETLNLGVGGALPDRFQANADSTVNIDGGYVGHYFEANDTSTVNINAGDIGLGFNANGGSTVNIGGGTFGSFFQAHSGSSVEISGGKLGSIFQALAGSTVDVRGGSVGTFFAAQPGSAVALIGGEFRRNGSVYLGSTITLGANDVFTGTLGDGAPFIFSSLNNDQLSTVQLTTDTLPPLDTTPIFIDSLSTAPAGLRSGQTLWLQSGGTLPSNFASHYP